MKGKLVLAIAAIIVAAVVLIGMTAYLNALGSGHTSRPPSASFSSAEQDSASTLKLTFGEVDPTIEYMMLKILLHFNDTVRDVYLGTYPFDPNGTGYVNIVTGGQNYSVFYVDSDSDWLVDSGEHVGVIHSGGSLPSGNYTVSLLWAGTGNSIALAYVFV